RRHTRFSRDWSSDVCSSDLPGANPVLQGMLQYQRTLTLLAQDHTGLNQLINGPPHGVAVDGKALCQLNFGGEIVSAVEFFPDLRFQGTRHILINGHGFSSLLV